MKKQALRPIAGLTATIIAGLLTGGAQAQDALDWTGFYAGVFGGYALDSNPASGSSIGPASLDFGGGDVLTGSFAQSSERTDGLFGGAAVGYNYQHNALVLGVEASAGLGDLGKSNSSNLSLSFDDGVNTANIDSRENSVFDINWYTSLQARIGLAHENWLFFLKGGIVVADASVASTSRLTLADPGGVIGLPNLDLPGASNYSEVLMGPAFGFGAEVMIAQNISLAAEYSYLGLPDVEAPAAGIGLGGLLGGSSGTTFVGGIHQIKAGVNYHF